jgi:SAM-dependent methyltransferase
MDPMDEAELQAMLATDERHWWYRGRRRVLRAVLDGLALPRGCRILDAGSGSGRTLDVLADYGQACGVDISPEAVAAGRGRGHDVWPAAIEALPFGDGAFHLVTCLDVLEHTPDDRRSLRELLRVTRPGGVLVLTVPAYPRLWSAHDKANHHLRRYTRASLGAATAESGWRTTEVTSFNASLLPVAAAVRTLHRRRRSTSELRLSPAALDSLLELPLAAEAAAIRRGVRLPIGLSLLAVVERPALRRSTFLQLQPNGAATVADDERRTITWTP